MNRTVHTELTIANAGWYFFYPKHAHKHGLAANPSRFLDIAQDTIDAGDLHCKMYEGYYLPVTIPTLPDDIKATLPYPTP